MAHAPSFACHAFVQRQRLTLGGECVRQSTRWQSLQQASSARRHPGWAGRQCPLLPGVTKEENVAGAFSLTASVWLLTALIVVLPLGRILYRLGFSVWWARLALIPLFNLIGLWWLAYMEWPISMPARDGEKECSEAQWKEFRELERQRRPRSLGGVWHGARP